MKAAIVELSKSHEECVFSQISFLQEDNNDDVSLFLHPAIKNQITYLNLANNVSIINFDELKGFKSLQYQLNVVKELSKFDKVIFNTASSSKQVRNIVFFLLFYKVECIGVLHNTKKLQKSFTQKIISLKIKKYFVLSDYLKDKVRISNSKIKLESFYPIFFPKFKSQNIEKKQGEVWFCIPGRVEFSRRDYFYLIHQLQKNELSAKIKFLILGNINTKDGIAFKSELERLNFESYFIFFNEFITNELYYSYIEKSDFILPLLKRKDFSYLNFKISGTFNLAFAFKKIIICDDFYKNITDLNENGIFYSEESFTEIISNTNNFVIKNTYSDKKWHYNFQYKKYINFIKS
ncbi:hypothetical protein CW731_06070 [Polaribacter sp. ALD11]|uniref:hypothetical protein n=1 Tax=Polaribacter sp. ALD11 TaxID=2058137 RepID=UPI000C30A176|nr:hypothetical protein [Polaribacter sp. ALD11]AUC84883.1 hypothetical protein CW731_06070 [Polaribacter sp. ALD11]